MIRADRQWSWADVLAGGLVLAWTAVAGAYVVWGRYVGDEGWYSLISRDVWRGRVLYRDMRFTQMPLLPYVYGLWLQVMPARIESGRVLSLAFGIVGILTCWGAARIRYGAAGAAFAVAVLTVSRATGYDFTNVKTQALSFALGAGALAAWAGIGLREEPQRREIRLALIGGFLAGAALLTRLSVLPLCILGPVGCWAAAGRRREGLKAGAVCAAGALLMPAAVCAVFAALSGYNFYFGVYEFHQYAGVGVDRATTMAFFGTQVVTQQLPWLVVVIAAGACLLIGRPSRAAFEWTVLGAWLAGTLIHGTRAPAYHVYQMTMAWAPALLGAFVWSRLDGRALWVRRPALGAWVVCALAVIPFQDGWLERDRRRTPGGVADVAAVIEAGGGGELVTFDSGVAFCAPSAKLLPGYEMSEFAIIAPNDEELEARTGGIAYRQLIADLDGRARWLVLSDFDLGRMAVDLSPEMQAALRKYEIIEVVANYGQLGYEVRIGRRR